MIGIAYLLDTWAWIDYWNRIDSPARAYIESDCDLVISIITLAEVAQRYASQGRPLVDARIAEILSHCIMIPMTREIATLAGLLRHREIQGGIADAIILATARSGNHMIVTGDRHFREMDGVVFIGDA